MSAEEGDTETEEPADELDGTAEERELRQVARELGGLLPGGVEEAMAMVDDAIRAAEPDDDEDEPDEGDFED